MKIGILTQPLGHNYGGILQNYALQKYLRRENLTIETIDLTGLETSERFFSPIRLRAGIAKLLKKLARSYVSEETLSEPLQAFVKENIDLTTKYIAPIKNGLLDNHNYDCYIVGSDQVWRPAYSPNLLNYFLDFTEKQSVKRVAYAASFGSAEAEYGEEQRQKCGAFLRKFDAVSVREYSSIKTCNDLFSVNAEHVCDPTLLLQANDYRSVAATQSKIGTPKNFCAAYFLNPSKEKWTLLQRLCGKLELMPVSLMPIRLEHAQNFTTIFSPAPKIPVADWLNFIEQSSFVLTDSFHGTVFSTIFEKPFLSINNPARGSDRIPNFLELLKLRDRVLENNRIGSFDLETSLNKIEWDTARAGLNSIVTESKKFISSALFG